MFLISSNPFSLINLPSALFYPDTFALGSRGESYTVFRTPGVVLLEEKTYQYRGYSILRKRVSESLAALPLESQVKRICAPFGPQYIKVRKPIRAVRAIQCRVGTKMFLGSVRVLFPPLHFFFLK